MKKNKLLLIAIVCFGFNVSAQLPGYVPGNGLVGWWPFTGNANDLGPNAYNGNVSGASITTDRFGHPNSAFLFDGINDQINITAANIGTSDFTVSGWFKTGTPLASNSYTQLFMAGYNNSDKVAELCIINWPSENIHNQLMCNIRQVTPNGDFHLESSDSVINDMWHHFAMAKTGTKLYLYLDGSLVDSLAHTASNVMETGTYLVGNGYGLASNRWFNGCIDDIGVWNRMLTSAEISALAVFTNTGLLSDPTPDAFSIWPNPATDQITINYSKYSNTEKFNVKLYNTIGQEVFSSEMASASLNADLSGITTKGIYIVKIQDDQNMIVHNQKVFVK